MRLYIIENNECLKIRIFSRFVGDILFHENPYPLLNIQFGQNFFGYELKVEVVFGFDPSVLELIHLILLFD